jgi:hypothetical protein
MSKIIIKKRFIKKIKIKIIVADQFAKSKAKRFILGQLFSPVLSKIEVIPKLGLFHTSLVIGPWLIEWNVIKKNKTRTQHCVFQEVVYRTQQCYQQIYQR